MERDVRMEDISDGKLYTNNDMVRTDCGGCVGCSECCRTMVDTIVLDPMDFYQLERKLSVTPEALLAGAVTLNVVDGIILPHLTPQEDTNACAFLDENSRCSVHDARPGFCRLFPLGRYYENGGFSYFLQTHECLNKNRSKVKIRKWLGIPNLAAYEKFINDWHYYLKEITAKIEESGAADSDYAKQINMLILQTCYLTPYDTEQDFYEQFYRRLAAIKE